MKQLRQETGAGAGAGVRAGGKQLERWAGYALVNTFREYYVI